MEKQSPFITGEWPALAAGQEERWKVLTAANARLVRGVLALFQQELEFGQELIAENLADSNPINEFFSGNVDFGAQWSAAQRRFERTVAEMRRINDEFYECLFEVAEMASGDGKGSPKEPRATAAPAEARAAGH